MRIALLLCWSVSVLRSRDSPPMHHIAAGRMVEPKLQLQPGTVTRPSNQQGMRRGRTPFHAMQMDRSFATHPSTIARLNAARGRRQVLTRRQPAPGRAAVTLTAVTLTGEARQELAHGRNHHVGYIGNARPFFCEHQGCPFQER